MEISRVVVHNRDQDCSSDTCDDCCRARILGSRVVVTVDLSEVHVDADLSL